MAMADEAALRAALDLATKALQVQHGSALCTLLGDVADVIGADTASLARIDLDGHDELAILWPAARATAAPATFEAYRMTAPTHPARGALLRSVRENRPWTLPIRLSEVVGERGWRETPVCREALGSVTDQLCLPLAYSGTLVTALSLTRLGGHFTVRDGAVLVLVAPHVRAAVARTSGTSTLALRLDPAVSWVPTCFAAAGLQRPSGASAQVSGTAAVSAREREVLDLVVDGLTDAAIGRRLGLATATVSKHLHRVYVRHGLGNRAVATRWWLDRRGPGDGA